MIVRRSSRRSPDSGNAFQPSGVRWFTSGDLRSHDREKLGRLREGGGWRVHGRDSDAHRATRGAPRVGYDYVHAAIDDHARLAYAEIHPDETAATCAGFLTRAAAWFINQGVPSIQRVMTDNALAYRRSHAFRQAVTQLDAVQRFARTYRPQTNGKAERFNRTLAEEWAGLRAGIHQLNPAGRRPARVPAPLQLSPSRPVGPLPGTPGRGHIRHRSTAND